MLSFRSALAALFVGFAAVAGCAAEGPNENVEASGESALTGVQDLGRISNGETKTGSYQGGADLRSFTFRAAGGDVVSADVTMAGGKAVAFIADINNHEVTSADNGTPNAHVSWTVVPAGPSRTLHVAFKDKASPNASYNVHLNVQLGACNPGAEPWYTYKSTDVDECRGLPIDCSANENIFKNACGCGCERPNP
jgi:hypothetical protein